MATVLDLVRQHVWWTVEIAREPDKSRNPYGDRPPRPLPRPGVPDTTEDDEQPAGRIQTRARADAAERERQWRDTHKQEGSTNG